MKKFFSRSTTNELFICDNSKVKNAIEKWLKPAGWSYDDFPKFLKLLHIPTPLKVIEVNSTQECVFKC